ncbi:MAG: U32 family peptidase [Candidatus Omnitrophica bacterium]|nr:U32 family peptidase [Candidatus Omnitrophota bacterium]MCM8816493.1 U32 family peptidase [Candidatus Omnitrophota bacterium]
MEDGIKFSVGYQLIEEGKLFYEIVREFRSNIDEVYFAWMNLPSGRGPIAEKNGYINWEAQKQVEYELKEIKKLGIKLNLLLNASCWGGLSLSTNLANTIVSLVDYLSQEIGIESITAFSPMVAYIIKKNFPEIEIRASVNMRIGSISAMEQLAELFDGFVLQREFNRDIERIKELKSWCDKNNKKLSMLANSGCINFCAVQMFHDNVIAHETEIFTKANITDDIPGNCWSYYKKSENWKNFLINHSWVRPEDIYHYREYFQTIKIATRINSAPARVIKAYCKRKYDGNLLDLFEPSHTKLLFPYLIDNTKFPDNWFLKILNCDRKCQRCDVCETVFQNLLIKQGQ